MNDDIFDMINYEDSIAHSIEYCTEYSTVLTYINSKDYLELDHDER